MATSRIMDQKYKFYRNHVITNAINANTDASVNVTLPNSYQKLHALIPIGWSPRSTWNTTLVVSNSNVGSNACTFSLRTISGSTATAQEYRIDYLIIYS